MATAPSLARMPIPPRRGLAREATTSLTSTTRAATSLSLRTPRRRRARTGTSSRETPPLPTRPSEGLMATTAARETLRRELEAAREGRATEGELADARAALDDAREAARGATIETERLARECEEKRRELRALEREIERAAAVVKDNLARELARARSARDAPSKVVAVAEKTAQKAEIEAEARLAFERAAEARFRAELEAERARYESNLDELRSKLANAATAKDDAESEAASLRRRCDALDERLARDRMALLDATSALETRGQLIATLRRRIESLEARESEARMELKLHAKKDRKVKFDGIRQHEFGAPVARVEATAVAKSNVDEQTPQSSSTRRAALQEIRRELADLSQ